MEEQIMRLIFTCSSEDIEFIELVKKEFSLEGTISESRISGITGYEIVMLILQIAAVSAATIVPFIVTNMTSNKENAITSKRCIIDNKNQIVSLEGYDEEAVTQLVHEAIQVQNK